MVVQVVHTEVALLDVEEIPVPWLCDQTLLHNLIFRHDVDQTFSTEIEVAIVASPSQMTYSIFVLVDAGFARFKHIARTVTPPRVKKAPLLCLWMSMLFHCHCMRYVAILPFFLKHLRTVFINRLSTFFEALVTQVVLAFVQTLPINSFHVDSSQLAYVASHFPAHI